MAPRPAGAHARKPALKWSADDRALMRADKVLKRVMEEKGPLDPEIDRRGSRPDPFEAVARAIVGQQLSTKAARSIWEKLLAQFGGEMPAPEAVLRKRKPTLRKAGLSNAKVDFLRDLAHRIKDFSDEDVIADLIEVKGVGQWTAEMFLMFHLAREDVVSVGDLGIRRAVQISYRMDDLPGPEELEKLAEEWRPRRTLACLYLWRSLDNTPT